MLVSRLGRRNVRSASGVAKTARLLACRCQKSSSSCRSVEVLADAAHDAVPEVAVLELTDRRGRQVLELDAVGVRVLRQRARGQVDGDARRRARVQQRRQLATRSGCRCAAPSPQPTAGRDPAQPA